VGIAASEVVCAVLQPEVLCALLCTGTKNAAPGPRFSFDDDDEDCFFYFVFFFGLSAARRFLPSAARGDLGCFVSSSS